MEESKHGQNESTYVVQAGEIRHFFKKPAKF